MSTCVNLPDRKPNKTTLRKLTDPVSRGWFVNLDASKLNIPRAFSARNLPLWTDLVDLWTENATQNGGDVKFQAAVPNRLRCRSRAVPIAFDKASRASSRVAKLPRFCVTVSVAISTS